MASHVAGNNFIDPVTPAEILTEVFLRPFHLSVAEAAARMNIPRDRLAKIVAGSRAITPDTAMRLAKLFGTSEEFWLNLQARYDLRREHQAPHPDIDAIERIAMPA